MYIIVIIGFIIAAFARDLAPARAAMPLAAMIPGAALMSVMPAAAGSAFLVYAELARRKMPPEEYPYGGAFRRLATRFTRFSAFSSGFVIGCYAAALTAFGWAGAPDAAGVARWASLSGALLIAPFVVSLFLSWIPLHYADRALRRHGPTLAQRLSFNLRQYVLTVLVPIGVVLGLYDAFDALPQSIAGPVSNPWVQGLLGLALVVGGYTVAPVLVVRLWKTHSMPPSPARERLTELCRRLRVRFRDIRIWETPGHHVINAAVMGLAGFARYIVISRSLLEVMRPQEVEAVFAHELGHARRGHMIYYLIFAADFVLLANVFDAWSGGLAQAASAPSAAAQVAAYASMIGAFAVYWGLGFGWLSRTLERDSDLFAAEVMGDYRPFASALLTIARLHGVSPSTRAWRHGSIESRVSFLAAATASPGVRERFFERVAFAKGSLVAIAALSVAAMALRDVL